MSGVDTFAVQLVLDGTPMNLTGVDLETAALALADRGHTYRTIADRCRITEGKVQRVLDAARQRAKRSAEDTHRRVPAAHPYAGATA